MVTAKIVSSLSIVLPAHNEEANIEQCVRQALAAAEKVAEQVEVVVVNDGSKDRTPQILSALVAEDPRVCVLTHEVNKGYGAAVGDGLKAARSEYVFFTDSDLQFDLGELPLLLEHVREYPIVSGYRANRRDAFHRKLNAWAWGTLVKLLFGFRVRDVDCAFKVFRRAVLQEITIEAQGAMINTEILAQATRKGHRIKEVPVTHRPRTAGEQSGANPKVVLKAFRELFRMYRRLQGK
jgi:glycosyltransferase involved in cell wall biosynthesis